MPGGGGSAGEELPAGRVAAWSAFESDILGAPSGEVRDRLNMVNPGAGFHSLPLPYTDPRATTHSIAWPVTAAIRSKSAS